MLTCGLETFQLPTRFNAGPEDADAKRSPKEEGQGEDYVVSTAVYGTLSSALGLLRAVEMPSAASAGEPWHETETRVP